MNSRASVCLFVFAALQLGGCAAAEERLRDVAPSERPFTKSASSLARGEQLYAAHCLTCHQADGGGVPNMQPSIIDSPWVLGDPQALALFVMSGGFGSAERKESAVDNVMPAFRQLSDDDLAQILSYIRQTFGSGAGLVTSAEVAEAKKRIE